MELTTASAQGAPAMQPGVSGLDGQAEQVGGHGEADTQQFITFTIGAEEYAVDIMAVREIKGWIDVTVLPNQPEYMRGVLNLRGVIVPIFDLRCRFGGGVTEATATHVMVIVAVGGRIMGILVDTVSDILSVNTAEILPVPEIDSRADIDYLTGLATVNDRMVAILKLDHLLTIDDALLSAQDEAE